MTEKTKERIAKVLARAGIASRRRIEAMIGEGRITLNGEVVTTPATLVDGTENIAVDAQPVSGPEETRLFIYHKPAGLITTHQDEKGRPTVFDAIKEMDPELPRLISIGRLDLNTEGLLLLSNDGELARILELPSTGWIRNYRVRAYGSWDDKKQQRLEKGMIVEGIHYAPIRITLERQTGDNVWLNLSLKEGKNREIRNVMAALGLQVNRLIRTTYGPYNLGQLPRGALKEVSRKQLRNTLPRGVQI